MSACPNCDYFNSKVNETKRLINGWVKRHRRCLQEDCGHRWYTLEVPRSALEVDTEVQDLTEIRKPVQQEESE